MIAAQKLTKRYGSVLALDSLSLQVPDGCLLGLLGPNGSGKSTLARLIMGFIRPDSGRLDRAGLTPASIGFMPERPAFPLTLRAREYLALLAELGGRAGRAARKDARDRLEQLGLSQWADARISAYSKGMAQRLALAAAIISRPPFLILDEPMSGLDPLWQRQVRDLVAALHRSGVAVILSTHRLDDVAGLCTHIAILNHGRLARCDSLADIVAGGESVVITLTEPRADLLPGVCRIHAGATVQGNQFTLPACSVSGRSAALRWLLGEGVSVVSVAPSGRSLADVYAEAMVADVDDGETRL